MTLTSKARPGGESAVGRSTAIDAPLMFEEILRAMADGVIVLDANNLITWSNHRLCEWMGREGLVGCNFYEAIKSPKSPGHENCPFGAARASGKPTCSTMKSGDEYFRITAAPLGDPSSRNLVVTLRNITTEVHQQQKLASIHSAGIDLTNMTPEELYSMTVDERVRLLKQNIVHLTQHLLNFSVMEIRLLDARTRRLEPLLAEGMSDEASHRVLYSDSKGNGVTGFVASTGKSYICEDTRTDKIYLEGFHGSRSSLTVPLKLHDQVIGTFNVESPEPRAFGESDQQFLEIFSRNVAVALNTLELLVVERAGAAAMSIEAIHSAVALPVDDILNDAVNIMERYIGHEPDLAERMQRILRGARGIKQTIQQVGRQMAPSEALPQGQVPDRPKLRDRRILVVDADERVREAAHRKLDKYGCFVETSHDGAEAVLMVRNLAPGQKYDAIFVDVRLPDMTGYEVLLKLKELIDPVPFALLFAFGYDSGHSIVKARQAGYPDVLYKPFQLDKLLDVIEKFCE